MARLVESVRKDCPRALAWVMGPVLLLALCAAVGPASADPTGKIQGKIVATDTGEPIGFVDLFLLPADTTMKRTGGRTNADGTFLIEAAPGRYTLQIRAMAYAQKQIDGIVIQAGQLLPFSTGLAPEAIMQDEIVVETKGRQNTEVSMLAARKKATSLGDAVSAEQVRKSPDKDAADVLRRVTGLSVSDGKYVFVRGLGERYSSTEVDGVRIASPEQNKRVVPLDLLPASLLENIVVQKTYTADRPGEFGGGDVQVRTKDFPGERTWSFSVSMGDAEGTTFKDRRTYASTKADLFGFGSDSRKIPAEVYDVSGTRPLVMSSDPTRGFTKTTLSTVARSFTNIWSPSSERILANGTYAATYGDQVSLLGHPLGLIVSANLSRAFNERSESQRFYSDGNDTLYDYAVQRSTELVQLGGIAGASYRLSPSHTLHVRGLYTNSADDEVRTYQGPDHNRDEATTGLPLVHRATRLMYVQRNVLSGTVEGRHDFARVLGMNLDWRFTRSRAKRLQPDRRETICDNRFYDDGTGNLVGYWALGSTGSREYGDMSENGWGTTIATTFPYRLGGLGTGKIALGYDQQTKKRENFYRRFNFYPGSNADRTASPDSIFSPTQFDSTTSTGWVEEGTLDQDNYYASQGVTAGYLSIDLPLGRRARANVGLRGEHGTQDVVSYDLFNPSRITAEGALDNVDWLPSGNVTLEVTRTINLRLAASRTLSRPDLNELSPSPSLEYVGGMQVAGNPTLERSRIDNSDLRVEAFPTLSEVVALGAFYKNLIAPIEQVIQGGAPPVLVPRNSAGGHNVGAELELRTGLGRVWSGLSRLALNANASIISSEVTLAPQLSKLGSEVHPLQGQADYLLNGALTYATPSGRTNATVLLSATGRRLHALGIQPLPDIYEQPTTSLDAALSFAPLRLARVKLSARNLINPDIQQLQGEKEVSGYHAGRSYSVALSFGS